jgi:AcrR family transcriptional regulator
VSHGSQHPRCAALAADRLEHPVAEPLAPRSCRTPAVSRTTVPDEDPRQRRRETKIAAIVDAAWRLARQHGIQLVSLRDLAKEVGMRQPSLYAYFDSKNDLFDAMFADGNRQLIEVLDSLEPAAEPRDVLKAHLGAYAHFAAADPARNSLLFSRVIPGFEPSAEAYALAQEALGRAAGAMRAAGVTDQGDIDCLVAMTAGLIEAQLSNDPGGDRWLRHLDRLTDLLVDDATKRNPS